MVCETESSTQPIHGVKRLPGDSWQIWSHVLKYPIYTRDASDARRIVTALAAMYPHSVPFDYSEVDSAISADSAASDLAYIN
jgi:hypothetical protein